jgi:hypothetical protein
MKSLQVLVYLGPIWSRHPTAADYWQSGVSEVGSGVKDSTPNIREVKTVTHSLEFPKHGLSS